MRIVGFLVLFGVYSLGLAAKLLSVDIKQNHPVKTIIFKFDTVVKPKIFTLANPHRLVIDLPNTVLAADLGHGNLTASLITSIRSGQLTPKQLRLVFEMSSSVQLKTKPLKKANGFVINLSANPIRAKLALPGIKPKTPPAYLPQRPPKKTLRDVTIVLDPGHGGKDPGAIGPRGALEKRLTLTIALQLAKRINHQPGMRAVLTRTHDGYIGLRERLKIARKNSADIFISIHADAFINRYSNGASVFALSQSGATSEAARWLAEKENYSELGGVNLASLDDQNGLIRTVLLDLSQTATINASLHLGNSVLRNLDQMTNLHNDKVEQARFMVLKSPDIPSILVETGFITNPREERNLSNSAYQNRLIQAIFRGLKSYFLEYPPPGTKMEVIAASKITHSVCPGENLALIAKKYHMTIAALEAINKLPNRQVRAGQTLIIPSA